MSKRKSDDKGPKTDLTKIYFVPMCKKGHEYEKPHLEEVSVSVSPNSKNMLECKAVNDPDNEYDSVFFYDDYFQWLLYTKEILMSEKLEVING